MREKEAMSPMAEIQTTSCEPCKKKKCKCDRSIPICGQCSSSPSRCNYSENNKRGIPSGYLGSLEQRLCDTELALHKVLTELHSLRSGITQDEAILSWLSLQSKQQLPFQKASRTKEWTSYPLETSQQLDKWQQAYVSRMQGARATSLQSPAIGLEDSISTPQLLALSSTSAEPTYTDLPEADFHPSSPITGQSTSTTETLQNSAPEIQQSPRRYVQSQRLSTLMPDTYY